MRPSRVRFAAFLAALAVAVATFGAVVLPRLGTAAPAPLAAPIAEYSAPAHEVECERDEDDAADLRRL